MRLVLVTDRAPLRRHAHLRHPVSLVVTLGSDGGVDGAKADVWAAAGWPVYRQCSPCPSLSTDMVRASFGWPVNPDDGWAVIAQQREAVLAPTWQSVISVVCAALQAGDAVVADVQLCNQGALEVAARASNCAVVQTMKRPSTPQLGQVRFWLGEVLAKGILGEGRRRLRGSPQVVVYAETPNHWRQVSPIVAELRRRDISCAFLSASVGGLRAFVPDEAGCEVVSLDRRALSPRALARMRHGLRRTGRVAVGGELSPEVLGHLRSRAEHARRVYEKAVHAATGIVPMIGLFGDASAHRPAAVARSLEEAGATTVTMQHGVVVDPVRYCEATQYVFVWDELSASRMRAAGSRAVPVIVGVPTIAGLGMVPTGRDPKRVLIAPTAAPSSVVLAWIVAARERVADEPKASDCIVRLHPSMRAGKFAEVLGQEYGLSLAEDEDLAQTLARVGRVITSSQSVAHEARLLGLPVDMLDGHDYDVNLQAARAGCGCAAATLYAGALPATVLAADWIERRLHGLQ